MLRRNGCNNYKHKLKIADVKVFDTKLGKFIKGDPLFICPCSKCNGNLTHKSNNIITLSRGGQIKYNHKIINDSERNDISSFIDDNEDSNLFRQYNIRGCKEPRVHVLLSSEAEQGQETDAPGPGYSYHTVHMKALPLADVPPVEKLAKRLGGVFETSNHDWNIGVDVIVYRDENDSIGWHADDTQSEDIVVSVVVETDERRIVRIRPKKRKKESYRDGDEQIELIVRQGDGYTMDGK